MKNAENNMIFFYLPDEGEEFPTEVSEYWNWISSNNTKKNPYWGRYHWVLQTYLALKEEIECQLVHTLPNKGIIITHRDFINSSWANSGEYYIVCLLVDREIFSAFSDIHIVHNPKQIFPLLKTQYISPLPQASQIPRRNQLGERFKVVGYYGYEENLDASFKTEEFKSQLLKLGLELRIVPPNLWNDFSDIDVILAIRTLGKNIEYKNKPALKLINAWLASVPIILGYESAYACIGSKDKNYIEATTTSEVISSLKKLKYDKKYRNEVVKEGLNASSAYNNEKIKKTWLDLLNKSIIPNYQRKSFSIWSKKTRQIINNIIERIIWRFPCK